MGTFKLRASCGHTFDAELHGSFEEQRDAVLYLERDGLCSECEAAKRERERLGEMEVALEEADGQRTIIVDCEPSGPDPNRHRILELGSIAIDSRLRICDTFQVYMRHENRKWTSAELRRFAKFETGVYKREAVESREAVERYAAWLKKHATVRKRGSAGSYKVARMCGFNVRFDVDFVSREFKRHDVYLPISYAALDVMEGAIWEHMWAGHELESYSLESLCAFYGIANEKHHHAVADCRATLKVLRRLLHVDLPMRNAA